MTSFRYTMRRPRTTQERRDLAAAEADRDEVPVPRRRPLPTAWDDLPVAAHHDKSLQDAVDFAAWCLRSDR